MTLLAFVVLTRVPAVDEPQEGAGLKFYVKQADCLPHKVQDKVLRWELALVSRHHLMKAADRRQRIDHGSRSGVAHDCRRDNRGTYREMLTGMAKESGIVTSADDDFVRHEHRCKGKKLSNANAGSATDPDAKIRLADRYGANTLDLTMKAGAQNLAGIGKEPMSEDLCDLVADKGYHSRGLLKGLDGDV